MTAQDVILLLLPVQLHDDREHKPGMLVPTPPTSPRTLSKQLYYGSTRCDSFSPDDREHKQGILAPTAPTSPGTLFKQLYYDSTRCDSPSASCPIA